MHVARWALLLGWLLLIVLLLRSPLQGPWRPPLCERVAICGPSLGNDLFWNLGLPLVLLCVVLSHELWRRICPLSFVSQLARALGRQRTVPGRNGKPQLVSVDEQSWLGRHHVQLQWSLLIAGLCLRILVVNSQPLALAVLFIAVLLAALVTGWAYAGKAWCQYICPFGTVQQVITGPRGLLGSTAHLDSPTRTSQSMCRTAASVSGQADVSACVACARPCIDIDAERHYWQTLQGKRGLNWAWYSYPGLVIGFFLLIETLAPPGLASSYLKSKLYTYDDRLLTLAAEPMLPAGWPPLPRYLLIPLLLLAAAALSQQLFRALERWQRHRLERGAHGGDAHALATHRTRLLATFIAVNSYVLFKGNPLPIGGSRGDALVSMLVMACTAIWLYRGWQRDQSLYERESNSTSLRRQLAKLGHQLQELLAGRRLQDLNAGEVFVLAKALPAQASSQRRRLYQEVLGDQLRQGRLDRFSAQVKLEELRTSLGLDASDHRHALELVCSEDPQLLALTPMELAGLDLRRSAACEEIEELLRLGQHSSLDAALLSAGSRQRLERIRLESGLDDRTWEELLADYAPGSARSRRQLQLLLDRLAECLAERASLERASAADPLLKPLLLSLDRQLAALLPDLVALQQQDLEVEQRPRPAARALALYGALPPAVLTFLASEDATTIALARWLEAERPAAPALALPEPEAVLQRLAGPDGSGALAAPEQRWAADRLAQRIPGGSSLLAELAALPAGEALLGHLEAPVLLDLAQLASLQHWEAGQAIPFDGDAVALLLRGSCRQHQQPLLAAAGAEAFAWLGLLDYMGGCSDSDRQGISAGEEGCDLLLFQRGAFRDLLDVSPVLEQALIRQLARGCAGQHRQRLH